MCLYHHESRQLRCLCVDAVMDIFLVRTRFFYAAAAAAAFYSAVVMGSGRSCAWSASFGCSGDDGDPRDA